MCIPLTHPSENDQTAFVCYANNYQGCPHERPHFGRTSIASTTGFSLA